jgi:hypothetical protein
MKSRSNQSEAIDRFKGGDPEMLAARIKKGTATQEDRDFVADFLLGKIKRPDRRAVRAYENQQRNAVMLIVTRWLQSKGVKTEAIIAELENETGLKRRAIQGIIKPAGGAKRQLGRSKK